MRNGRVVHVGSVDSPITVEDVKQTILEFWKMTGKVLTHNVETHNGEAKTSTKTIQINGIDFLGWEFAFDMNETAKQYAASNKVDIKFKKIPREVLEKKAVEQGDIVFYELAYLDVVTKIHKNEVTIQIKDFIIPTDDIPAEVQKKHNTLEPMDRLLECRLEL